MTGREQSVEGELPRRHNPKRRNGSQQLVDGSEQGATRIGPPNLPSGGGDQSWGLHQPAHT
ncbi:hypothetical protein JCM33774_02590 [Actinophytocola sp. KF-1]